MIMSTVRHISEAPSPPSASATIATRNAAFEKLLPIIRRHALIRYRHLPAGEREEIAQELIVSSFIAFSRLCEQNKQHRAFGTPLATYAAAGFNYGRRVGASLNCDDVTSAYCQRQTGVKVESLQRWNEEEQEWDELVVEVRHSTPAEIATLRIDFWAWLASLPRRDRWIAWLLAAGEAVRDIAQRFGGTRGGSPRCGANCVTVGTSLSLTHRKCNWVRRGSEAARGSELLPARPKGSAPDVPPGSSTLGLSARSRHSCLSTASLGVVRRDVNPSMSSADEIKRGENVAKQARGTEALAKDLYQVKFEGDHGVSYGIANTSSFDERVQREARHGRVVVEHAVFPKSVAVPEERLIDIPLDFGVQYDAETGLHWGGDEYHRYVTLQSLLHEIRHDRLPTDRLCLGHLIHVPVGDGHASYCVTHVKRALCRIEWRGFCLDRWIARPWGWGGEFRRKDVEPLVLSEIRLADMFADQQHSRRIRQEQAAPRFLREFKEQYGLPRDVQDLAAELKL